MSPLALLFFFGPKPVFLLRSRSPTPVLSPSCPEGGPRASAPLSPGISRTIVPPPPPFFFRVMLTLRDFAAVFPSHVPLSFPFFFLRSVIGWGRNSRPPDGKMVFPVFWTVFDEVSFPLYEPPTGLPAVPCNDPSFRSKICLGRCASSPPAHPLSPSAHSRGFFLT